jgi:hypothetical protein
MVWYGMVLERAKVENNLFLVLKSYGMSSTFSLYSQNPCAKRNYT